MTGINAPYEKPKTPFLEIKEGNSLKATIDLVFENIRNTYGL
jgi:adenylylsulfate kinase-like enzyme